MSVLSTRYVGAAAALLLLASGPVLYHATFRPRADECRDPAALLDPSAIAGSRLEVERSPSEHGKEHVTQWTQGIAQPDERGLAPMDFRILRSFDPKYLYLKPMAFLPYSQETEAHQPELRWLDVGGERVPIHVVHVYSVANVRVVAFLYVYDARPVGHPFRAQLLSAVPQLFSGTRPLTLFEVSANAARQRAGAAEASVLHWIGSAWEFYRAACAA